jgi:REP element-mobilizing transposase RayT
MSRGYKFRNPDGLYFVSFAVVYWIDVFTRNLYKNIFLECLRYCQKHKHLEIVAWCIMSNHVHLVFRTTGDYQPGRVLGDIKRYSSRKLVKAIANNPRESRRDWLLQKFRAAAIKSSNVWNFQFWRHDNHPIELWSNKWIAQKVGYIHNNPVKAGIVLKPEDYLYSSASDYIGRPGLLEDVIVADI